jgi:hypothetical protein
MASLSFSERYATHQYTFTWAERHKWHALMSRFQRRPQRWETARGRAARVSVPIPCDPAKKPTAIINGLREV